MEFEEYQRKFTEKALALGYSAENLNRCLIYAKKLIGHNLPVIYNLDHLCALVGYHPSYILRVVDHSEYFYRIFKVPKRNKTTREIAEPLPSLKEIQLWILHNILYKLEPSKFAKAFIPRTSLKQNILFHKGQSTVFALDIINFFSSIKRPQITALFMRIGYSTALSDLFAKICCLDDCLPQGAPTSPYISNLILNQFDDSVANYCISKQIRYTRYADDLTFSGDFQCKPLKDFVKNLLVTYNLVINDAKTRIMRKGERQFVTGVVVNEKLQVSKEKRLAIRQQMHFIKKFGLADHIQHKKIVNKNYVRHLLGQINFIIYINPDDSEFIGYRDYLYPQRDFN